MDTPLSRTRLSHVPGFWSRVRKALMLFIILLVGGLKFGLLASAQAFTLDNCKGFSGTGYLECSTAPQVITPWRYMIPGYVFATPFYLTEIQALEDYKAKWAAYLKICEPITHTLGDFDPEWGKGYNGNWDYGRFFLQRRKPYTITVYDATNSNGACVPYKMTTGDYLYHHRDASCGEGWLKDYDPRSAFCYQYDPEEADTCPTWNPVYPSTGVKIHHEDDLLGAGTHPLHLTRFYRSRWINGSAPKSMPLGVGWTHSYDRVVKVVEGAPVPTVRVLRGDGKTRTFLRDEAASTPSAKHWRDVSPHATQDRLIEFIAPSGETQGWQYAVQADDSIETYDAAGRLNAIDARNGWRTILTYSDASTPASEAPKAGLLLSVRNHFGRELRLSYDSAGRIATLTAPGGDLTRYAYDALGNLVSVTKPDGTTTGYHYEDSRSLNVHALTGITDALGARIATYSYDANGRAASTEKAGGIDKLQFQYSLSAGSTWSSSGIYYTPTPGATSTYTGYYFSSQAGVLRPTSASSPPCPLCGNSYKSVVYDANKRKTKTIAHDGTVKFIGYDAQGRVTEEAIFPSSYQSAASAPPLDNAQSVTSTQWHGTWNLPLKVAEAYLVTSYSYDSKGNLLELIETPTTDSTGFKGFNATPSDTTSTTRWTYDAKNLPVTIVELEGSTETGRWTLSYNSTGDAIGMTHVPTATSASLDYDAAGRLIRISASNGTVASFTANSRGQMVLASMPDGSVSYSYDARNLVTEIRFSDGSWVRYTYDANHRLIEVRDSSGHIESLAAITLPQLARNIALHTAPAWIISVHERIARMLIPEAHAYGLAIPAGIVMGIFLIAETQIINTPYNPDGACCGDYPPPTEKPRNLKTFWLDQVGVLTIGDLGSSSSGRTYDKAGLLVSPKSCIKKPGTCDQNEWRKLQDDVDSKCDHVQRACKGDTLKPDLPVFRDRQRACAEARDKLNRQCFFGGDEGHRNEAHEAWEGYAKCIYWMSK